MSAQPLRLVVFDVDGTLYLQKPLQKKMAKDILLHYALRPWRLNDIRVIQKFRHQREVLSDDGIRNITQRQYDNCGVPADRVRSLVERWIYQHPLPYLTPCRFDRLPELFETLREHGIIIGVWSDYPANDKLNAMGLSADIVVSAEDVGVLKPNPHGLRHIMDKTGVDAAQTLMVGDRRDRDLAAARKLGVECVLKVNRPANENFEFETYAELSKRLQARLP